MLFSALKPLDPMLAVIDSFLRHQHFKTRSSRWIICDSHEDFRLFKDFLNHLETKMLVPPPTAWIFGGHFLTLFTRLEYYDEQAVFSY